MTYKLMVVVDRLSDKPTDTDLGEVAYRIADWLCIDVKQIRMGVKEESE